MTLDPLTLRNRLRELQSIAGKPGRYVVAFSGGVDSTVLLHALASGRSIDEVPLLAVHVDHGLHSDSAKWEEQCRARAKELSVDYLSRRVAVNRDSGCGPEAAAREARYAVLGSLMEDGDWLLSAHHENDQAETLLLNLLRGSSLTGLAGMGAVRRFASGYLVRPLLGTTGEAIRQYALAHELRWTDDPSNDDTALDRNYLRQEVMPVLAARWPAVAVRLGQSADLAAEASDLLAEFADADIGLSPSPARLDISTLLSMSHARQRNVVRRAVQRCGLPPPPATRLYQIVRELVPARQDAQPLVAWPGAEIRRYRGHLYILASMSALTPGPAILAPGAPVDLGPSQGMLCAERNGAAGIDGAIVRGGLEIHYRVGGEEITLPGQDHSRKLKKLLQEEGIVPWMRDRLPLLFSAGQLVAVADLWVAAPFLSETGYSVRWHGRPELY